MVNANLYDTLYQKISDEQKNFTKCLSDLHWHDILDRAYEYVIREGIISTLEYHNNLPDDQMMALLQCENTLDELYEAYEGMENDYMFDMWLVIQEKAETLAGEIESDI